MTVKKGDLGGWIEKEENLSQKGDCWVCRYANVYNDSKVYEDAVIFGNTVIVPLSSERSMLIEAMDLASQSINK